jgi:DNA-binding LytR/AlgR family response regulator
MPYGRKPLKRIVVQVFVTTILGLAVIILLTEIVSWIARGRPALPNFYSFDIFIFVIWFLVINGIYIGLHYYLEHKTSEHLRQEEKKLRAGGFRVKKGKEDILIPFQNIYGFYSEGGFTYLQGKDGSKYLTDQSLDKTAVLLPEEWFFRINRQFLVHRQAVTGFRRAGDGKLEVNALAIGGIPASIPVSRQRAIAFRKWFHPVEEASEG